MSARNGSKRFQYRIRLVGVKEDVLLEDDDKQIVFHARRAVELSHKGLDGKWRRDCVYLYGNPPLATQEARALVTTYRRQGIDVECNLQELRLEVSHGRG